MTTRSKFSNNRQTNNNPSNKNSSNNNKAQNDDDNCSVVCYKDLDDGHVGVVRIRQQPVCSACNLMRGTLSLYCKHVLENNHRENVKKLCDENRYVPSVFDKAIHLAFHNNLCYQSDKFHFRYKHTNEEPDNSSQQSQSSTTTNVSNTGKADPNNEQKHGRKRRNLQVTLVFQDKTYTKIGTTTTQIREQLLNEMVADRANDITALPMEIYYIKKKIAPDNIHHNNQKSSIIFTMAKDQSQVMIKKQQQDQEPFDNGHMSSAKTSSEDTCVEQTTAIVTHELLKTEKIDVDEPPSLVDDVINVCKETLNDIVVDIYSKSGEMKREQQFLSGIARRSFKKKNTFFCDICSIFLTSEKYCLKHLNGVEHLEKTRNYQASFLPWRQAMQKSLIVDKPMSDIMGASVYDDYKKTLALYLAPNSLSNRGRFCCAYCEFVFTDQWSLEKHLHTVEHKNKQTSTDHKDLVVSFANIFILPSVFKFNGITQLSEIPDDIKNRYQWRCATREQLNDDTNAFIKGYPFDTFEGTTRIVNAKPARKSKSSATKPSAQKPRNNNTGTRNQQGKRSGFTHKRGAQFPTPNTQRGSVGKRSFPVNGPSNKRFRPDVNNSFPVANRGPGPMRHFAPERHSYSRPAPYNTGTDRWPARYPVEQQREEVFERSNYELRSLATNNNEYYAARPPAQHISRANTYDHEQPPQFNRRDSSQEYNHQQSNYDPNFIRAVAQAVAEYHPAPNPPPFNGPSNRTHNRSNTGPPIEFIHQIANTLSRSQHPNPPEPMMRQGNYPNHDSLGPFGVNHNSNNGNPSYFSSNRNQQQNSMGTSGPPIRSYSDYRASSGPASSVAPSTMYPPINNIPNPAASQPYPFDDFARPSSGHSSSNNYGRSGGPSFGNGEQHYGGFGQPTHTEQSHPTPWRGSARGGNNNRGRTQDANHFPSSNKQPGSIFSYSSSSNKNTNTLMGGRGTNHNGRGFGGRR